jgi:hypothetical protein
MVYIPEILVELQLLGFAAEALGRYSAEAGDTNADGCDYPTFFLQT